MPKYRKIKIGKLRIKNKRKAALVAMLFITAIIVVLIAGALLGLWAARPTEGYATCTVIDVGEDNEDVTDEAKVTGYKVSIGDKTFKEIRNLKYDDYKVDFDETTADKAGTYITENNLYYWKITFKGSERWYRPSVGENEILMVDETEVMEVYLEDEVTLNRTFLGSEQTDWTMRLSVDDEEGLLPGFNFKEDKMMLIWFDFNFTRAAQDGFARVNEYYNKKKVDGTHLYIGVSGMVVDNTEFEIDFGSGKGDDAASTYDCNNIDVAFGFYETMDYKDS